MLARGVGRRDVLWGFFGLRGAANKWSRWAWDDAAVVTRRGVACQGGEPRALVAALRRMAAQPQTGAAGQADAIAILMRRTLMRTSAPILNSLRRMGRRWRLRTRYHARRSGAGRTAAHKGDRLAHNAGRFVVERGILELRKEAIHRVRV